MWNVRCLFPFQGGKKKKSYFVSFVSSFSNIWGSTFLIIVRYQMKIKTLISEKHKSILFMLCYTSFLFPDFNIFANVSLMLDD